MLLFSFLVLIPRCLLGLAAVHWLWRSLEWRDLIVKLFLAGPVGIGLSSLIGFLWIWAGLDLAIYAMLESAAAVLIFALLAWRERRALAELVRRPRPGVSRSGLLWLSLLAAALLLYGAESWINSVQYPHGGWDAWNHWNVVSRFIYRGGADWMGTFLRTGDHPDYPLLVPISNALSWSLISRETTRAPIALSFFFTLCLAGLLFGLLNWLRDVRQGTLGTIVLLSHSYVAIWAMAQYVDMDLAFYFLASAGLMLMRFSGGPVSLAVLAGLTAGLGAWTKNEGLAFALLSLGVWIFAARRDLPAGRGFLTGLAVPLLVVGLFKVYLAPANDVLGAEQDVLALVQDFSRYQTLVIVGAMTFRSMDGSPLLILAGLSIYAALVGRARPAAPALTPAALLALGQLGMYFAILVITPHSPDWHVRSSIGRLYLHVAPLLLLCTFLWLKSPLQLDSGTER